MFHQYGLRLIYRHSDNSQCREYQIGEALLQVASQMRIRLYGNRPIDWDSHRELLQTLLLEQNSDEAHNYGFSKDTVECALQLLDIVRKINEGHNPMHELALKKLGHAYASQGKQDEAMHFFIQHIEMNKRLYPKGHYLTANALRHLGNFYELTLHQPSEALNCHRKALKIRTQIFGERGFRALEAAFHASLQRKREELAMQKLFQHSAAQTKAAARRGASANRGTSKKLATPQASSSSSMR